MELDVFTTSQVNDFGGLTIFNWWYNILDSLPENINVLLNNRVDFIGVVNQLNILGSGCRLKFNEGRGFAVEFDSEEDVIIFMLRWNYVRTSDE
jgi:hypothetical protein